MTVKSIHLIWIVVNDLKKAVKYYTDVIGLKLEEIHEDYGWAELSAKEGGAKLGIAEHGDMEPLPAGSNAVITFTVTDIEQAKKELLKKGAKMDGDILEIPGHVKIQTVIDQDGNRLQLVQTFH